VRSQRRFDSTRSGICPLVPSLLLYLLRMLSPLVRCLGLLPVKKSDLQSRPRSRFLSALRALWDKFCASRDFFALLALKQNSIGTFQCAKRNLRSTTRRNSSLP
jgi:hypothetical protein